MKLRGSREQIGFTVLVLLAVLEMIHSQQPLFLDWNAPVYNKSPSLNLDRFRRAVEFLPPIGEIGYITSPSDETILKLYNPRFVGKGFVRRIPEVDDWVAYRRYYMAQYALAPRVLRVGPEYPFVIGNFVRSDFRRGHAQRNNLQVRQNLGTGVVVYQSVAKK